MNFKITSILIGIIFFTLNTNIFSNTNIYLPNSNKIMEGDTKDVCDKVKLDGSFETIEGVLFALFVFGKDIEKENLSAPFYPESLSNSTKKTKALVNYFLGAKVEKNGEEVILSFSKEAMIYLNNTITIQLAIKDSIKQTIEHHFPKTKNILYKVGGKIIKHWDA